MIFLNTRYLGYYCCLLFAAVLAGSCEVGIANKEALHQHTETVRMDGESLITTQDMVFKAAYTPVEWQALQAGETTLENYEGHLYFRMSILPKITARKIEDLMVDQSTDQWQDFLFHQKEKFILRIAEEQLPCVLYHVVPAGISGYGAVLTLVFKDTQLSRTGTFQGPIRLEYQDDLWTNSLLTFDFQAEELNQLPLPELDN